MKKYKPLATDQGMPLYEEVEDEIIIHRKPDEDECAPYAADDSLNQKELTDLSKVDWANLSGEEFGRMLADAMENRTEEDLAAEEAQSRFLVDRSPSPT
jgi:hypothetical protein